MTASGFWDRGTVAPSMAAILRRLVRVLPHPPTPAPLPPWPPPFEGRRLIHISVRATPNPSAKEFFAPGTPLLSQPGVVLRLQAGRHGAAELQSASPLAAKLVALDGVSEVLLATDSVTLNAAHGGDWETLEPQASSIIAEALLCLGGRPTPFGARLSG